MRCNLCWNCGRVNRCQKSFPYGRPKKRSECSDFEEAPPEPVRITIAEIAKMLGMSSSTVFRILAKKHGTYRIVHMVGGKGLRLTYERTKNRIYFYKEINRDER